MANSQTHDTDEVTPTDQTPVEETRPEQPEQAIERSVTIETLRQDIEDAVRSAEARERDLAATQNLIRERVRVYRAELNTEERARLGAILAEAAQRLAALREKGAETIGGASAQTKVSAEATTVPREVEAIIHPPTDTGPAESVSPDQIILEKTVVEPEITFEEPTPIPEAAFVTSPTARELLLVTKVRERYAGDQPKLEAALRQVRYAERRGILGDPAMKERILDLVRSLSGVRALNEQGERSLDSIAAEVGVDRARLEDIVARHRSALEDRAREDVQRESRVGMGKIALKGVA
ncbi:MAG: hypothetical protein V1723_04425, partial [Candidatus Uhrbacteria bacterium]